MRATSGRHATAPVAAGAALALALVLAGCSGRTTGATNVAQQSNGTYSARLNARGSCDQSCSAFIRWRRVGTTTWTNGPTINDIHQVADVPWYQDATGLAQRAQYEYQACGKEASWDSYVCVGPNGTSSTERFATGVTSLTQLSSDPYTNTTSQHATEVEPDSFASGSTIVDAFQVGRFFNGGASNIGWARSTDGGASWSHGFLPGITTFAGGSFARVSDPSVAYRRRARRVADLLAAAVEHDERSGGAGEPLDRRRRDLGEIPWRSPSPGRATPARTSTRTGSPATTPRPARSTATATWSGTTTATATA
jgi:hypothetical protein